jgi:hypothetical protein
MRCLAASARHDRSKRLFDAAALSARRREEPPARLDQALLGSLDRAQATAGAELLGFHGVLSAQVLEVAERRAEVLEVEQRGLAVTSQQRFVAAQGTHRRAKESARELGSAG